jgi:hypothetical protein
MTFTSALLFLFFFPAWYSDRLQFACSCCHPRWRPLGRIIDGTSSLLLKFKSLTAADVRETY